ncbi:MAG TPA: hypothetical protein VFS86_02590 [Rhodanobacteraceae bacterium]|nr:hypothetical protein [Rhodanobacteraceae bacterium]
MKAAPTDAPLHAGAAERGSGRASKRKPAKPPRPARPAPWTCPRCGTRKLLRGDQPR